MAFSRYGSRGIGGLRGQFQQPQQMQQQGMQGFNLSGPRPLGPAQMQQMGAVAGDYGQRGRDAQMQALQRFNPKMRSDHRILVLLLVLPGEVHDLIRFWGRHWDSSNICSGWEAYHSGPGL